MSYYAEETYTVYNESFIKARKVHSCDACAENIQPGHVYARIFILFDGSARSVKRCLKCQRMHEHLRTLGAHEDMWPKETLNCGLDYEEEWGKPPPEDIAQLAFLSQEEAQRELLKDG